MAAVHQFLPNLAARDAIGQHTLRVRAALRDAGVRSDIYAAVIDPELRGSARHVRDFDGAVDGEPTYLLYHSAVGSHVADLVLARPEPKLVDYHNITPPEIMEPWQGEIAVLLANGRRQLADFADHTVLALADSSFNESELHGFGFEQTAVVPVMVDVEGFGAACDEQTFEALHASKRGTDWLFVGRIAPNKSQHDIVRAFAVYRRHYDPTARLWLVGGEFSWPYANAVRQYVAELGLGDCADVLGSVSDEVLVAYYRAADVFVCLSEHEGFCVPLLEAMHTGVPVIAYAEAAVPETLAGGGVLLDSKRPAVVAAAVARVAHDDALRAALIEAGRRRVGELTIANARGRLLDALTPLLEAG